MKGSVLVAFLALSLFVIPSAALPDSGSFRLDPAREPDGFLGVQWGEDLSKVPGMVKIGLSGASTVYSRKDESATVGLVAKIREVQYFSFDGKFYAVKIFLEPGEENWQALRAAITEKYGSGYDAGGGNYLLLGTSAGMHLRCPPASGESWNLSIFSIPLTREADAATQRLKGSAQ